MNKEEIKQWFKDELRIKVDTESGEYGCSGSINVTLSLEGEEISSGSVSGSDIEDTAPDREYGR